MGCLCAVARRRSGNRRRTQRGLASTVSCEAACGRERICLPFMMVVGVQARSAGKLRALARYGRSVGSCGFCGVVSRGDFGSFLLTFTVKMESDLYYSISIEAGLVARQVRNRTYRDLQMSGGRGHGRWLMATVPGTGTDIDKERYPEDEAVIDASKMCSDRGRHRGGVLCNR